MLRTKSIDGELLKLKDEIRGYAIDYGLDFFEVIFEVCDFDTINILAAQGGFPSRYPHWRFGMEYDQLSKGYAYGLQKIYEMVINTNPSYAYLLKANHMVDQKVVMAHVYGHSDFFKNNMWFSNTNRRMIDVMANHGTKIRRYMDKFGQDKVEAFIDKVLSIENLIDINELFETLDLKRSRREIEETARHDAKNDNHFGSQALQSFMRSKIGKDANEPKKDVEKIEVKNIQDVRLPERDVMKILMNFAPLHEWQADIIGILRDEAYYFLPQRLTKIMNEGWASYWHSKIMTERALRSSEIVDFADHHAGVMAMSRQQINPYKIGIELFRDIEYRWDTGKFGLEYENCENMTKKLSWDTKIGKGKEKIFEVRRVHNDLTFIDEFLTPEFCERAKIFTYKYNPKLGKFVIDTRDFLAIKSKLLTQLTNFGSPMIEVENINYKNRSELHLVHRHHGVDLDMSYAADTMKNIYSIWSRPVNLSTKYDEKEVTFTFDGKELKPTS